MTKRQSMGNALPEECKRMKLEHLRERLAVGETQLDRGEGMDGGEFFKGLREEGKR